MERAPTTRPSFNVVTIDTLTPNSERAVAVQQQGNMPSAILSVHFMRERLGVLCALMAPGLEQAMPCRHIHRAEYRTAGIPSA